MKKTKTFGSKLVGRSLLALVALAAILGTGEEAHSASSEGRAVQVDRSRAHDDVHSDALMTKAQSQGRVRVLVKLKSRFQAEGTMTTRNEVLSQRQAIASTQEAVMTRLASSNATLLQQYKYLPSMAMNVDPVALQTLQQDPNVIHIQEDKLASLTLAESVPLINAHSDATKGVTGLNQVVAILDTGVDLTHEFLAGKVVAEACFSSNDPGLNATSVCPNGEPKQVGPGAGAACFANDDLCAHGTHVTGIAAGAASPAGFDGVAHGADIIAIQVFSRFDDGTDQTLCADSGYASPCVFSFISDQLAALEYVFTLHDQYDIAAVNMSLGGGDFNRHCDEDKDVRLTKEAIDNLRSVGIATVISSGNAGFEDAMGAPACISTAVSVGATTKDDTVADFSNSADFLSLLAPGASITSSVPGNTYDVKNGTSMAAPHVAGAIAVLKEAQPDASVDAILTALQQTGIGIMDHRNGITVPRIDVQAALEALGRTGVGFGEQVQGMAAAN